MIGLEACSGAHFLGRALRQQGHDVRLIAAQFVKPFVKSNKNDFVDAEAIAEAVERKNMRFVPIKTDDQLDLQAMHRIRDRLVSRRTAVINQIRAFLLERGMVFAQKPAKQKAGLAEVLENADNALTPMMRNLIGILWDEWKTVEGQIDELTDTGSNKSPPAMQVAAASDRSQVSAPSSRRPSWPLSATARRSARDETLRHGSASCRDSTRLVARRGYWASASVATSTCARFWFMAHEPRRCG